MLAALPSRTQKRSAIKDRRESGKSGVESAGRKKKTKKKTRKTVRQLQSAGDEENDDAKRRWQTI